jgi:hypothetical protein
MDPASATKVQPIVGVDSVEGGKSITISVSFLNPESPPETKVMLASQQQLVCTADGSISRKVSLDMSTENVHLIHVTGTGKNGTIDVSLCRDLATSPTAKVYFYDSEVFEQSLNQF